MLRLPSGQKKGLPEEATASVALPDGCDYALRVSRSVFSKAIRGVREYSAESGGEQRASTGHTAAGRKRLCRRFPTCRTAS
jgi:hypothetical protein